MRTLEAEPSASDLIRANESWAHLSGVADLEPYQRCELAADVTLFRGRSRPKGRGLLVAFTARFGRVTIATAAFLQCIPASDWDVLMLRDSAQTHYRRGCAGFADGFPALAERVAAMIPAYDRTVVMGASIGGFPAIRLALAMEWFRGVSFGGTVASDIDRMFHDPFPGLAFDPICACLPQVRRDLVFVHGADHPRDRRAARNFAKITGGRTFGMAGYRGHAVVAELWQRGRLSPFLAALMNDRLQGPALHQALTRIVAD